MSTAYIFAFVIALICNASAFVPASCPISNVGRCGKALNMGIFDGIKNAFSNAEYASPPEGIRATARHILVKTPNDAQVALKKLEEGALFSTLASEISTCPSGRQGGSLGSFTPGTMVREFDDVIFSPVTQIGQIVGPIQTQFCEDPHGTHLLAKKKVLANEEASLACTLSVDSILIPTQPQNRKICSRPPTCFQTTVSHSRVVIHNLSQSTIELDGDIIETKDNTQKSNKVQTTKRTIMIFRKLALAAGKFKIFRKVGEKKMQSSFLSWPTREKPSIVKIGDSVASTSSAFSFTFKSSPVERGFRPISIYSLPN
eukprot:scaffold118233_cov50-Attheya_sp.AAC.2